MNSTSRNRILAKYSPEQLGCEPWSAFDLLDMVELSGGRGISESQAKALIEHAHSLQCQLARRTRQPHDHLQNAATLEGALEKESFYWKIHREQRVDECELIEVGENVKGTVLILTSENILAIVPFIKELDFQSLEELKLSGFVETPTNVKAWHTKCSKEFPIYCCQVNKRIAAIGTIFRDATGYNGTLALGAHPAFQTLQVMVGMAGIMMKLGDFCFQNVSFQRRFIE